MVLAVAALIGAGVLLLAGLTGLGERRRGGGAPLAVLAGLFFPVAWVVWYVRDERPHRRLAQRAV